MRAFELGRLHFEFAVDEDHRHAVNRVICCHRFSAIHFAVDGKRAPHLFDFFRVEAIIASPVEKYFLFEQFNAAAVNSQENFRR